MDKVFSKHLANVMLKCNFSPTFKNSTLIEEIKVEPGVLEKMKRFAQRIEILGNLVKVSCISIKLPRIFYCIRKFMLDGFMNLLFESFVNALLSFLCSKFFQAEKDPTKKKKFAEDLKNEQGELDIFVINQETGQEFNYVVVCMLQLVHRTAQNDKIINEIVSNCLFCI